GCGADFPGFNERLQSRRRDVLYIGFAAIDRGDLAILYIDPRDTEPSLGELHSQRQADISQADDAGAKSRRPDSRGQLFKIAHVFPCWTSGARNCCSSSNPRTTQTGATGL